MYDRTEPTEPFGKTEPVPFGAAESNVKFQNLEFRIYLTKIVKFMHLKTWPNLSSKNPKNWQDSHCSSIMFLFFRHKICPDFQMHEFEIHEIERLSATKPLPYSKKGQGCAKFYFISLKSTF